MTGVDRQSLDVAASAGAPADGISLGRASDDAEATLWCGRDGFLDPVATELPERFERSVVDPEDVGEVRAPCPACAGACARRNRWGQDPPEEMEPFVDGEPGREERCAVPLDQGGGEDPADAVAMKRGGEMIDLVDREETGRMRDQLTGVFVTVPRGDAEAAPGGGVT